MASETKAGLGTHTWVSIPAVPHPCRRRGAGCLVLQDLGPPHL